MRPISATPDEDGQMKAKAYQTFQLDRRIFFTCELECLWSRQDLAQLMNYAKDGHMLHKFVLMKQLLGHDKEEKPPV